MAIAPTAAATLHLVEGTGTRSFTAQATNANDWLACAVLVQDDNAGTFPVSETTLGTFAIQLDTGTGAGARGRILWTVMNDAAGGTRTVTITPSVGTRSYRGWLTVVRGSRGPGAVAGIKTAQLITLARMGYASMILTALMDWSTGAVGTLQWVPGGATIASQQGTNATYIVGRWDNSGPQGSASTGSVGTAYVTPAVAALEMLGSSDESAGVDAGPYPSPLTLPLLTYDSTMQGVIYSMRPYQRRFQWQTQPWLNTDNVVPGGSTTFMSFTATVTPAGAYTQQTVRSFTGTITSAGVLTVLKVVLKSLTGTVTSTGVLTRQTGKPLTGTATPGGALTRQTAKTLTGLITSSGALTNVRIVVKAFAGLIAGTGALTRQPGKALTGTITSGGVLTRQTAKTLAGTITSSATLVNVKVILKAFAGTVTSAGALTRQTNKPLAGTVTSSGALARTTAKTLTGTITSTGVLTRLKVVTKLLAGTISSTGTLTRSVGKQFAGSATPAGSLVKFVTKSYAGTITSVGALTRTRTVVKTLTGTITSVGTLTRRINLNGLVGVVTGVGTLARLTAKNFLGTIVSNGVVTTLLNPSSAATYLRTRVHHTRGTGAVSGREGRNVAGRRPGSKIGGEEDAT